MATGTLVTKCECGFRLAPLVFDCSMDPEPLHCSVHAGDIEKKHKLEVSPLCDREANTIGNIQIGKFAVYLLTFIVC